MNTAHAFIFNHLNIHYFAVGIPLTSYHRLAEQHWRLWAIQTLPCLHLRKLCGVYAEERVTSQCPSYLLTKQILWMWIPFGIRNTLFCTTMKVLVNVHDRIILLDCVISLLANYFFIVSLVQWVKNSWLGHQIPLPLEAPSRAWSLIPANGWAVGSL